MPKADPPRAEKSGNAQLSLGIREKRSPDESRVNLMKEFHPPHIYQNETIYFITGRVVENKSLFHSSLKKELFLKVLKISLAKFSISIFAFVVNDNHYHLLAKITNAQALSYFVKNLHENSARLLNKIDGQPGRQVWYQYWDRCIRSEKDFWVRFNYIHHNPVKHGYFDNQNKLKDYKFCSFYLWARKNSLEWLESIFETYPIADFTLEDGD